MVVCKTIEEFNVLKLSKRYAILLATGANIQLFSDYNVAKEYAWNLYSSNRKKYYYSATGFKSEEMINVLSSQLKKANTGILPEKAVVYLVTGSGATAMALKRAFRNWTLKILPTGGRNHINEVKKWANSEKNVEILEENNDLKEIDIKDIPYKTVNNYDSLIYKYVYNYGNNGDYIWNIAADEI